MPAQNQTQGTLEAYIIERLLTLPKYHIILHNDDTHDMLFVVAALLRIIPSLSRAAAFEIMLRAHQTGKAIIATMPRETAEFYCGELKNTGLQATIEPA